MRNYFLSKKIKLTLFAVISFATILFFFYINNLIFRYDYTPWKISSVQQVDVNSQIIGYLIPIQKEDMFVLEDKLNKGLVKLDSDYYTREEKNALYESFSKFVSQVKQENILQFQGGIDVEIKSESHFFARGFLKEKKSFLDRLLSRFNYWYIIFEFNHIDGELTYYGRVLDGFWEGPIEIQDRQISPPTSISNTIQLTKDQLSTITSQVNQQENLRIDSSILFETLLNDIKHKPEDNFE